MEQLPKGRKKLFEPAAVVSVQMDFLRVPHVLYSSTVTSYSILRRILRDAVVKKRLRLLTSVTLPGLYSFE